MFDYFCLLQLFQALRLSEETLEKRTIEYIDIVNYPITSNVCSLSVKLPFGTCIFTLLFGEVNSRLSPVDLFFSPYQNLAVSFLFTI